MVLEGGTAKAQWNAAAAAARVFGAAAGVVADAPAAAAGLPRLVAAAAAVLQRSASSKARMQVLVVCAQNTNTDMARDMTADGQQCMLLLGKHSPLAARLVWFGGDGDQRLWLSPHWRSGNR